LFPQEIFFLRKYTLVFRSVRKSIVKTNLLRDIRTDW